MTDVPIVHELPSWYPVAGGWFTKQVADTALGCVVDVTFLDARHQTVAQPDNF